MKGWGVACKQASQVLCIVNTDHTGRVRVTGGKHLKQSQAYPAGFGKAVTQLYIDNAADIKARFNLLKKHVANMDQKALPKQLATWKDAKVEEVIAAYNE